MDELTHRQCVNFISDRDVMLKAFTWVSSLLNLSSASVFIGSGKSAVYETVIEAKNLLHQKTGAFSAFRSYAKYSVIPLLAKSGAPELALDNTLAVYDLLKNEFCSSSFLPFTAAIIAESTEPGCYSKIVERTKTIFRGMKAEHPFLTSSEDSVFCAMLALTNRSETDILKEAENCYVILKENFYSPNAVQALACVLALYTESADEKCRKVIELFDALKNSGNKYGTYYELATLGTLAMSGRSIEEITGDIAEISTWLSKQKGFSVFSITKKMRLMYAGLILQCSNTQKSNATVAASCATISILISQQVAMCAAVAATAAASASASG